MQKKDNLRNKAKTRKELTAEKKAQELPAAKFMNDRNEDGSLKYPAAEKVWSNVMSGSNNVLSAMRHLNVLLHELRWRKKQSLKYELQYKSDQPITMLTKDGAVMDRDECYLAELGMSLNCHSSVEDIREHLVGKLLPTCDGKLFTFDLFNEYVLKVDSIVTSIGYDLFPDKIVLIEPK